MGTLPLFDPPAVQREDREAALAHIPPPPSPGTRVARAVADPVGHLTDCQEPDCRDCAALRAQGFERCSRCSGWAHRGCQYLVLHGGHAVLHGGGAVAPPEQALICPSCLFAEGRPSDGREMRYEWTPPLEIVRRAKETR